MKPTSFPFFLSVFIHLVTIGCAEKNATQLVVTHTQSLNGDEFPCSFPFCADGRNCANPQCSGCPFNCFRANTTNPECPDFSNTCKKSCTPESTEDGCSGCIYSNPLVPIDSRCPLGTFRDVTDMIFSGEDSEYWHQWFRSGKPHWHFSSALMVDLNGDSVLDYFTSMHGTMYGANEFGTNATIQLGEIVANNTNTQRPNMNLKDASWRIVVDDPPGKGGGYVGVMDKHGDLVADLDNDGILDIFIMSGGASGKTIKYPKSKDNLLLFGARTIDEETGAEITVFKGGRNEALQAGLAGRTGRGRMSYLLDVNGDGLLDIFFANVRRKDNSLAPGSLYINQGNRTWREDSSMTEFADAVILTDADGDSIAEEIIVIRGFCFPQRENPNDDKTYGPFPDDIKDFCSTRPVGSTAIYKFNNFTQKMEEISPKYTNIDAAESMQPECCPHGIGLGERYSCVATSITSGDFDGDGRSDHILLYARRMEFFFSSDRPVGELPIEKKYVGLTIDLPEWCSTAYSVRLVDINNSGRQDIIVMCQNVASFLIYSRGKKKDAWRLHRTCNDNGSLGDIVYSSFNVTLDDLMDACDHREEYRYINDLCEGYETGNRISVQPRGLTLADINNDGFADVVVGSRFGYQNFFLYEPSFLSQHKRHISFRLIGDGKDVNRYGIGATLVLFSKHKKKRKKTWKQFREISSYQHTTEKKGHQDEKIAFGLDRAFIPVKLVARWPNRVEQTLWLREFDFSMPIYPAIDVNYHDSKYFRIRSKKLSDSGRQLCIRRAGIKLLKLELAECAQQQNSVKEEHFFFNEWGMLKNRRSDKLISKNNNSGENCLIASPSDAVVRVRDCEGQISRTNSWHETKHGFLRWSGSSKVLGVEIAAVGETPKLLGMDMATETRMWFLENVS